MNWIEYKYGHFIPREKIQEICVCYNKSHGKYYFCLRTLSIDYFGSDQYDSEDSCRDAIHKFLTK